MTNEVDGGVIRRMLRDNGYLPDHTVAPMEVNRALAKVFHDLAEAKNLAKGPSPEGAENTARDLLLSVVDDKALDISVRMTAAAHLLRARS